MSLSGFGTNGGLIKWVWKLFSSSFFWNSFRTMNTFWGKESSQLSLRPQIDLEPETKKLKSSRKCESYFRGLPVEGKGHILIFRKGLQKAQKVICSLFLPQQQRTSFGLSLSCWESTDIAADGPCLPHHKELQKMWVASERWGSNSFSAVENRVSLEWLMERRG